MCIRDSVEVTKKGGRVVLIGLPSQTHFDFELLKVVDKELDVLGIFRYANAVSYTHLDVYKRQMPLVYLKTRSVVLLNRQYAKSTSTPMGDW